jgi:hypothetical protein
MLMAMIAMMLSSFGMFMAVYFSERQTLQKHKWYLHYDHPSVHAGLPETKIWSVQKTNTGKGTRIVLV